MEAIDSLILGAIAMASLTAALFFLRFWKQTGDRFFLLFAVAFSLDALSRAVLGLTEIWREQEPFFYLIRLFSFALILVAIIDKNRGGSERKP
ncbi:MAG: DUF5985 family protein [Gammaproteobacteria bacterium]